MNRRAHYGVCGGLALAFMLAGAGCDDGPSGAPPSAKTMHKVQQCVGGVLSESGMIVKASFDRESKIVEVKYAANGLSDAEVRSAVADAKKRCAKWVDPAGDYLDLLRSDSYGGYK